jgi:tetratricopeptide (TPR) repeat protein
LVSCLAEVGTFAEGLTLGEAGIQIAEAVDEPESLIIAYRGVGWLYLYKGDFHRAIPMLERGLSICQVANIPGQFRGVATPLGAAYTLAGRVAEALPLLEQVVQQTTSTRRQGVARLSEAYLLAGRLEEALSLAQQALELARAHKERGHEAWVLRLLGDIVAHCTPQDVDQAEAHYQQALALAEEFGMRPLQAHCHRGLGTLYAATGQWEQAHTELSTAIEMYQSMDMTFWLPQTAAALAQVEGR